MSTKEVKKLTRSYEACMTAREDPGEIRYGTSECASTQGQGSVRRRAGMGAGAQVEPIEAKKDKAAYKQVEGISPHLSRLRVIEE
jgi:hypothetical protein